MIPANIQSSLNNIIFARPEDNVAVNATPTIDSGTPASLYPVQLVIDYTDVNRGFPSLLNETHGRWVFDFGSAQSLAGAIFWHNFDPGLAVSFKGNASNSWGSPTLNKSLTIPNRRANNYTIKYFLDLRPNAPNFQYYAVDVTGTNSAPIGLKVMLLNTLRQPVSRNIDWSLSETEVQTGIMHRTDSRYGWTYDLMSYSRTMRATSKMWSDIDNDMILGFFRSLAGIVGIGAVIPRPDQQEAMIGRWFNGSTDVSGIVDMQFETKYDYADQHSVASIDFIEEFSGDPEWS
jgi:hypothetical protein